MLYGDISLSYFETIDRLVMPALQQRGSKLMRYVVPTTVEGESVSKIQRWVGEAYKREGHGALVQTTKVEYEKRRILPEAFSSTVPIDMLDVIKQGLGDPGEIAVQLADSMGRYIDGIITRGIGGASYSNGEKKDKFLTGAKEAFEANASISKMNANYDLTNTIPWNDCSMIGDMEKTPNITKKGLSVSKLQKAVRKLKEKYADNGPIVCYTSAYGQSSLIVDPYAANLDFNIQPAMSTGQINPISGIHHFVTCEAEKTGRSAVDLDGTGVDALKNGPEVEYAYVYAMQYIQLGSNMPLVLNKTPDPNRHGDPVIDYTASYGCTRMFEDAVVRIEILKSNDFEQNCWFV